jgi:CheY-like chemotaxis protein
VVTLPLAIAHDAGAGKRAATSTEAAIARHASWWSTTTATRRSRWRRCWASSGQTAVAFSGTEALNIAESFRPSLAILDIGMPGMDGCELARRLRADPARSGLTLIALTGWGQPDDRVRIAQAGFDHHLLKPVDMEELSMALRRLAQRGLA